MLRGRLTALFLLLALTALTPALAEQYPAPVQHLVERGAEVVTSFQAPAGLIGYIFEFQGERHVLYLTADQKHAITGIMVNERGENLTAAQLAEFIPKGPDYTATWQQAEQAHWIAQGAKEPKSIVYAFIDPYCPYCNAFWKASQFYEKAGLQMRWLLVSVLMPDGVNKAAAILEAADPAAALQQHERAFNDGGIASLKDPKPETAQAVKANVALLEELGVEGIPVVLYKDTKGDVHVIVGVPKLSALPEIFNLPEQPVDDPSLAQYR